MIKEEILTQLTVFRHALTVAEAICYEFPVDLKELQDSLSSIPVVSTKDILNELVVLVDNHINMVQGNGPRI
jgi:hypothetical protein